MPYYLAPYIGAGTDDDPFRPRGSDQPGWRAIDLRPDASLLDGGGLGVCVLYLPVHDPDPLLDRLGDAREETPTTATRNRLRTKLNLPSLPTRRIDQLIGLILRQPPANGWKPLAPVRDRFEVWLDGLVYEEPFMQGGASDDFNRANETPLAAPWVRVPPVSGSGFLNLASNAVNASANGRKIYYYTSAASSADQYSQATMITGSTSDDWAPSVRAAAAGGFDAYGAFAVHAAEKIGKYVNDVFTTIAAVTVDVVNGDTVRIEAEGSTLRYIVNGSEVTGSPTTDTSLTLAGDGPGLVAFNTGARMDDWEGGDLGVASAVREYKRFFGPALLTNAAADLYTVPADKRSRVLNIHASNPTASPVDLTLSIGTDAAATRVYDDFEVAADSIESNYDPYDMAEGEKIQGLAGTNGVMNLTITGYEDPA